MFRQGRLFRNRAIDYGDDNAAEAVRPSRALGNRVRGPNPGPPDGGPGGRASTAVQTARPKAAKQAAVLINFILIARTSQLCSYVYFDCLEILWEDF